jgi:hypothetical protein
MTNLIGVVEYPLSIVDILEKEVFTYPKKQSFAPLL